MTQEHDYTTELPELRRIMGWDQEMAAEKIGASRRTLQRLEAGELKEPKTRAVQILLDRYLDAMREIERQAR